jgi:hypothetical protein
MHRPSIAASRATCLFGGALFSAGLAATAAAQPTFTTSQFENHGTDGYVSAIVVTDLNGDGAQDFLVNRALFREGLGWFESDGQDPPAFTKTSPVGSFNYIQGDVTTADLDGDGDQDIIFTQARGLNYGVAALNWDENDGNDPPAFSDRSLDWIDNEPGNYDYAGFSCVTAADINGDGHIDIAVTAYDNSVDSVVWFENNGAPDPSFTRRVVDASLPLALNAGRGWGDWGSVTIADVTNDGHADLVVGGDGAVVVYASDGAMPTPSFTKTVVATPAGGVEAHVVDLNNDTYPEILYGTRNSDGSGGVLGYLANSGATPPVWTDVPLRTDGPYGTFESGDIDGNGFVDFVVSRNRTLGTVLENGAYWFDNDGATLTRRDVFVETSARTKNDLALFDFDADGDLDILNATRRQPASPPFNVFDELLLHTNDLDPTLPVITTQPLSQFVSLPGDGVFTIAAMGDGVLTYQWKLNGVDLADGTGVAGAETTTLTITGSTNAGGTYTCAVTNLAGTTLSAPAVLGVGPSPSDCVGDINGDGVTDVFDFAEFAVDFGCVTPE